MQVPLAPALAVNGERRLQKKNGSAGMERAVALAPPTTVLMTDPSKVCQELPIMMLMGRSVKLEAGIAGKYVFTSD